MKARLVAFGVILVTSLGIVFYMTQQNQQKRNDPDLQPLPIINPIDVKSKFLVDSSISNIGQGHKIADFELVDQKGNKVSNQFTDGYIYVADFFFTTCGGICPIMTKSMGKIQEAYENDPSVKFLSHSVWPEIDTVAQIARYAEKFGVIYDKWRILTGSKKKIYDLARKSYMVAPAFNDTSQAHHEGVGLEGGPDDFIHTQWFTLVDPDRRIRGFYDGTKEEDVDRLINDIKKLQKEYDL